MNEIIVATLVLVGSGLSALVTYLIARRSSSGSIATSEAESLWKEANAMRQELRDEVILLRGQLNTTQTQLTDTQTQLTEAQRAIKNMKSHLDKLEGK